MDSASITVAVEFPGVHRVAAQLELPAVDWANIPQGDRLAILNHAAEEAAARVAMLTCACRLPGPRASPIGSGSRATTVTHERLSTVHGATSTSELTPALWANASPWHPNRPL
jgi:hypothetical protein